MNFGQKLIYTAFGAALMLLGVLAANHVTAISANPNATQFDEIICKRLTVILDQPHAGRIVATEENTQQDRQCIKVIYHCSPKTLA